VRPDRRPANALWALYQKEREDWNIRLRGAILLPRQWTPADKRVTFRREQTSSPMTKKQLQKTIDRMVQRIVDRFNPDRVILFGSHARGTAGPDSDVDLLVVMPVAGSKREKQLEVRLALHEFKVSKDIIITTPEDFEWRKEIPGTVERPAAREGKVVYARV